MSADLAFWLTTAAKIILTAGIVVTASFVTERSGPLLGALVATLPVTVWPAYVFLSLDHDADYLAAAATTGLAANAVSGVFVLVYAALARRWRLTISFCAALMTWILLASLSRSLEWSLASAALLNLSVFPVLVHLARNMREAEMPPVVRRWSDLPLRTGLVCALMGLLLFASTWAGPDITGIIAVYPVSSTSLMLILQPRVGGRVAAAVFANGVIGFVGIGFGLAALSFAAIPLGPIPALAAALVIPVMWNFCVWRLRARHPRAA